MSSNTALSALPPPTPRTVIDKADVIVLKFGSMLVADFEKDCVRAQWMNALARDVEKLLIAQKRVIIVSSGGIALGRKTLGISNLTPPSAIALDQKQAASAVGQFHVFKGYHDAFLKYKRSVAQVLLTMTETENRRTHLNARQTLFTLLDKGIVPIINENDTVSTEEIRFGDNDRLAVRVAQMVDADAVVLFSTIDGLYTDDPLKHSDAEHISIVEHIGDDHIKMAGEAIAGLSTGGMKSKINAAISATRAGIPLIIANGMKENSLSLLLDGALKSTIFLAKDTQSSARKKWIQGHIAPKGSMIIDAGAAQALKQGNSLLPIGITSISGTFERGDPVQIFDEHKSLIGIGLSAYTSDEFAKIIGKRSEDIPHLLGYSGRNEIIHRNDMALN